MNTNMSFITVLVLFTVVAPVYTSGFFGDVNKIPTTGASCATAKQDKLSYCGVEASKQMARTDLSRVNKYKSRILSVARQSKMDASVIAAIISRETRGGSLLKGGWGDRGNGFGLMQVDKNYHTPEGAFDSEKHITQAVGILTSMFWQVTNKFPGQSLEKRLKGAIAAYNAGTGNVRDINNVDSRTTGGDYANDVVARAMFYKVNGY